MFEETVAPRRECLALKASGRELLSEVRSVILESIARFAGEIAVPERVSSSQS